MRRISLSLSNHLQPRGFTLVELLVVITILAIVASIGYQVSASVSTRARIEATNVTLRKIDAVLKERYEAIIRSTPSKLTGIAKVNYIKNALIRFMPQTDSDLTTPSSDLATGYVSTTDKHLLPNDPLTARAATGLEPAEILYQMVTQKNAFGFGNKTIVELTPSELADLDNDGNPEIVDSWGTSIRFYRWPTRFIRPVSPTDPTVNGLVIVMTGHKMTPAELNTDPLDPFGLPFDEEFYSTRNTFSRPMVMSAGPDRDFGLADYTVNDAGIRGHLASPKTPGEYGPIYDNRSSLATGVTK